MMMSDVGLLDALQILLSLAILKNADLPEV